MKMNDGRADLPVHPRSGRPRWLSDNADRNPANIILLDFDDFWPWTAHKVSHSPGWFITAGCVKEQPLDGPEPDWSNVALYDDWDGTYVEQRHQWWLEAKEITDGRR